MLLRNLRIHSTQHNEFQKIKPITDEELTAAIRKHIAQRKARRNKRTSGKQLIVHPDRFENSQQCPGNNAKFIYNRRSRKTNIVTTQDIPPRTEICVPYRRAYWDSM